MKALLSAMGRTFLRDFGASLIILIPGILAAPNFNEAYALAVAAIIASISAGIRAIQAYVPQLYIPGVYGTIATAVLRSFVAGFLVMALGVLSSPNFAEAKSAFAAGLIAVISGVFVVLQRFLTPSEDPAPQVGLNPPRP